MRPTVTGELSLWWLTQELPNVSCHSHNGEVIWLQWRGSGKSRIAGWLEWLLRYDLFLKTTTCLKLADWIREVICFYLNCFCPESLIWVSNKWWMKLHNCSGCCECLYILGHNFCLTPGGHLFTNCKLIINNKFLLNYSGLGES